MIGSDERNVRAKIASELVMSEVLRASRKYPPFNSTHEGYGVLLEEVDELWEDIKANRNLESVEEAIQVAAMAIRYITDCGTWGVRTEFVGAGSVIDPVEVPCLVRPERD